MNTFKECLTEDYTKAIAKSFDTLLGKLDNKESLPKPSTWKRFPKIVETPEHSRIVSTFRPA